MKVSVIGCDPWGTEGEEGTLRSFCSISSWPGRGFFPLPSPIHHLLVSSVAEAEVWGVLLKLVNPPLPKRGNDLKGK